MHNGFKMDKKAIKMGFFLDKSHKTDYIYV